MISGDFNITINTCLTNFYVFSDTSIYKVYVVKFVTWHEIFVSGYILSGIFFSCKPIGKTDIRKMPLT